MLVAESKSYEALLDLLADWLIEDFAAEVKLRNPEFEKAANSWQSAATSSREYNLDPQCEKYMKRNA